MSHRLAVGIEAKNVKRRVKNCGAASRDILVSSIQFLSD